MVQLTVGEAAKVLGLTEAGVRKRVQRQQIPYERGDDGRLLVWVSPGELRRHTESRDESDQSRVSGLVDELHDRIRYLERQVEEEREARRRADTILAQLSQANAEQARTIRALEAPAAEPYPEEPPLAPEAATEQPGRVEPQAPLEGAQPPTEATDEQQGRGPIPEDTSTQTPSDRPWWQRLFGG